MKSGGMGPAVAAPAGRGSAPSFWLATCGEDLSPRPPLPGDRQVDVAIAGAGYTGLWTAYHLLSHDPSLRVAVVEREIAGWGASGRNGGWCSALFAAPWGRVAAAHGRDRALALRRALERTVDDVGEWCTARGVDAHFAKGGTLTLARDEPQLARLRAAVAAERAFGGSQLRLLSGREARERIAAANVVGAAFTPHCAAVHPARLARGLARVVEEQGGRVYERSAAREITPGRVRTDHGELRADVVVRATEGYTADLPGVHRLLVPIWSLVLATEPVPDDVWSAIGWRERETMADQSHLLVYAQRTADGRVVFGGRSAPYLWGSRTGGQPGRAAAFARLEQEMRRVFPQLSGVAVTHRWSGVLGASRDWQPAVVYDRTARLAWAGGYVGDGVGCAALAGRTLADLILGRDTEEARLPWVGHRWRRWEPEPLRWLGIHATAALLTAADQVEKRTGRAARPIEALARLVSG